MAILRFMAHDHDCAGLIFAAPKKRLNALDHRSVAYAFAVHLPLQTLPSEFAIRQQANGVPYGLLMASKRGVEQPQLLRRRTEYIIVTNDRIVKINSNPQFYGHGRQRGIHFGPVQTTNR